MEEEGHKDLGRAQLKESISLHIWNLITVHASQETLDQASSIVTYNALNSDFSPMAMVESLHFAEQVGDMWTCVSFGSLLPPLRWDCSLISSAPPYLSISDALCLPHGK